MNRIYDREKKLKKIHEFIRNNNNNRNKIKDFFISLVENDIINESFYINNSNITKQLKKYIYTTEQLISIIDNDLSNTFVDYKIRRYDLYSNDTNNELKKSVGKIDLSNANAYTMLSINDISLNTDLIDIVFKDINSKFDDYIIKTQMNNESVYNCYTSLPVFFNDSSNNITDTDVKEIFINIENENYIINKIQDYVQKIYRNNNIDINYNEIIYDDRILDEGFFNKYVYKNYINNIDDLLKTKEYSNSRALGPFKISSIIAENFDNGVMENININPMIDLYSSEQTTTVIYYMILMIILYITHQ